MRINNNSTINFGQLYMPTNYQITKQWGKLAGKFSYRLHEFASDLAKDVDIYIKQTGTSHYDIKVGPKLKHAKLNPDKRNDLIASSCCRRGLFNKLSELKQQIYPS